MALKPKKNKSNKFKRSTTEQRKSTKGDATAAMHTVSKIVDLLKPWELSATNRFKTYQLMLLDDAVFSSIDSRITSIEVAQSKPQFQFNSHSKRSVELNDYLTYCLSKMRKSPRQVGRDASEMVYNGIAPFEIATKLDTSGSEYNGRFILDDLIYIDPLTLDPIKPFVTNGGGSLVKYWRQIKSAFRDTDGSLANTTTDNTGAVQIDARKVAIASYAASSSRPLGTSALDACYTMFREKKLLQDYLLMGVSRDLNGLPQLRVPLDLLEKANGDPNSDAAKTLAQLMDHMTNLHSSDQSYSILPSSLVEGSSSIQEYGMEFLGVQGSKQFDLASLIEQKRRAIFNVLGAGHLIAGEDGGGSLNLYEGKASSHAYAAFRDNLIIEDMWNSKIIPLLLRLNGWGNENPKDIPRYVSGEVQPLSADEQGKFAQRVSSVGLMPVVPETVNHFLRVMGTTYRVDENMSTEDLRKIMSNFDSNAGQGDGTSGTGTSQSGGANSSLNSENKA